ncbi:MAG: hypothetical protein KL863_15085 [Rhizobium sp.]|nr:hypothetical protein [Rhizobium sp.]
MKITRLALLLLSVAFPALASAQEEKVAVQDWLIRQMATGTGLPFTIAAAEARMRSIYAVIAAQGATNRNVLPRARAQHIAKMLEKDLDNDGNVTSAELVEALGPQASKPLNAVSGVNIAPTKEQVDSVLSQLLAKELAADRNGDGTIDFAEIRQHAHERSLGRRRTQLNLGDPTAIRILDTSGDKIVSEAEFLAGARQAFASADTNKDGSISRDEAMPHVVPRFERTF